MKEYEDNWRNRLKLRAAKLKSALYDYAPGHGVRRRLKKKLKGEEWALVSVQMEQDKATNFENCDDLRVLVPRREYTGDEANNKYLHAQVVRLEPQLLQLGITQDTLQQLREVAFDIEAVEDLIPSSQWRLLQRDKIRMLVHELGDAVNRINNYNPIVDETEILRMQERETARDAEDARRRDTVARISEERDPTGTQRAEAEAQRRERVAKLEEAWAKDTEHRERAIRRANIKREQTVPEPKR